MKSKKRPMPKNLPLLLKKQAETFPDTTLQASKDEKGKFVNYSYKDVYYTTLALARVFKEMGIQRAENVAIVSDNRREWFITDFALLSFGAVDVPRGCDSMAREIIYIISFSECKVAIFENEKQFYKVTDSEEKCPLLKTAILYDCKNFEETKQKGLDNGIEVILFSDLLEKSNKYKFDEETKKMIEADMEAVDAQDIATIIFTSGTTGLPKGVMLTHRNFIAQCEIVHSVLPIKPNHMWLSVLPIWHSFERAIIYFGVTFGTGLAYSKPVGPVMLPDFATIRPQWMSGVPRLWDSLAKNVIRAMKKQGGTKYRLFNFFIKAGACYAWARDRVKGFVAHYSRYPRLFDFLVGIIPFILLWPIHALGEVLVYKKIRQKLGGRIIGVLSGGGALQKETDNFYRAIGINLLEGYGITEAAPVLSVRTIRHLRPGCVGEVYPCVEVKVVAEKNGVPISYEPLKPGKSGLVFAKGDQIMKGYYKQPELTKTVITEDGWLNTGDLGMMTCDNEIKITGRAKDTIVLVGGENIEPLAIEIALNNTTYVETAVILGQDQKYLGALVVPSKESVLDFAKSNKIEYSSYAELLDNPKINAVVINDINKRISSANGFRVCERIFKIKLLQESFVVGKELSVKQELMRFKVNELYKAEIASLFE